MGGRAVLPADRQAAAQAGDRDRHPVRRPPTELFEPEADGHSGANQLVLRIQPNEGASLAFEAKIPGSRRRLQEVRMDFRYGTAFAVPPPEAYERLLLDVMLGDPTLYTRTDEVESAWRFITSILDAWKQPDAPPPPVNYVAGSWGPEQADALIAPDQARVAQALVRHEVRPLFSFAVTQPDESRSAFLSGPRWEFLLEHRVVRFEYAYVGLPALMANSSPRVRTCWASLSAA